MMGRRGFLRSVHFSRVDVILVFLWPIFVVSIVGVWQNLSSVESQSKRKIGASAKSANLDQMLKELLAINLLAGLQSSQSLEIAQNKATAVQEDCRRLVNGQLLFYPQASMWQGTPYIVSARLSRGTDPLILGGWTPGSKLEQTLVSCMASLTLDSQEPDAFIIQEIPKGRSADQALVSGKFAQWDWRVTPKHYGMLHLLLYVTPTIYIDNLGAGVKQLPQQPRVISVKASYLYVAEATMLDHPTFSSGVFTLVVVPIYLWGFKAYSRWREDRRYAKKASAQAVGFM
jgi:hypothetical protein